MASDRVIASKPEPSSRWSMRRRRLTRFLGWWSGIFLLMGPLSVCPFCGQPGCGVGVAAAGVMGGIVATVMTVPRWIMGLFKQGARKEKKTG